MSKWEAWLQSPWEWRSMLGGLGCNKEFEGADRGTERWLAMGLVASRGHARKNHALKLANAKQASALRASVICYFIFEQPCGSQRLAFAIHSRSMSDSLDRPAQRPSPLPPLPSRRPREAG